MYLTYERVKAVDLKPGDLYSSRHGNALAQIVEMPIAKVIPPTGGVGFGGDWAVRTDDPCPEGEKDIIVFRITIHREGS